jgi:hypothetical protein
MRARLLVPIGVFVILGAMSVPAQQASRAVRVLPEVTRTVFATIEGSALSSQSAALPQTLVRLRDARIGRIVASQLTDEHGLFRFRPVDRGTYIVELMADPHTIVAASALVNVNASEVAQTTVRQPDDLSAVGQVASHRQAAVGAVTSAAAFIGIPASRVIGEDISPR